MYYMDAWKYVRVDVCVSSFAYVWVYMNVFVANVCMLIRYTYVCLGVCMSTCMYVVYVCVRVYVRVSSCVLLRVVAMQTRSCDLNR